MANFGGPLSFGGNSNVVAKGSNVKVIPGGNGPRVPFSVHQSFLDPSGQGNSVKSYLDALAAVKANSATQANAAAQAQNAPAPPGGVGGGGGYQGPPTTGNPMIDALQGQLSGVQQQNQKDVAQQNLNAQAGRDRIAQGSTALQGQLSTLGAQTQQANTQAGQAVGADYAHALQNASAGNSAVNADLAAQGAQAPLAQQAQRQQDLVDQQARQQALQTRLGQISGNDFTSKQANAAGYTSGAGAVLEAALQKNLGSLNVNSTNEQQKIKDAIAQEQIAQDQLAAAGGGGGGGGGGRRGGGGGGRGGRGGGGGSAGGGGGTVNPDGTYSQFNPGSLGDAIKVMGLGANDANSAGTQKFNQDVANITNGLPKGSKQFAAAQSLQTFLLAKGPAGLSDATKAWEKQKQYITSQRQQAANSKNTPYPKGNAKATAGYSWGWENQLLNQLAQSKVNNANAQKPSLSNLQQYLNFVQTAFPRKGAK